MMNARGTTLTVTVTQQKAQASGLYFLLFIHKNSIHKTYLLSVYLSLICSLQPRCLQARNQSLNRTVALQRADDHGHRFSAGSLILWREC